MSSALTSFQTKPRVRRGAGQPLYSFSCGLRYKALMETNIALTVAGTQI